MKIFLTGEPRVGKSTLIAAVIDGVENKQGFITKEVRTDGVRTSFNMISSAGDKIVLCDVNSTSEVRVSRYGVNIDELNKFIANLPDIEPGRLIYIDEVGQMELYSDSFKALVSEYLEKPNPLIGTLSSVYSDEFTEKLRKREDVEIIQVTLENRDSLKDELTGRVAKYVD